MGTRLIAPRSLGKHLGHAAEGHCRGLFRRLLEPSGFQVRRRLPFRFPVEPDVVVLDRQDLVRLLVIVAYSRDASGSHKKFYRTRLEYLEVLRCWRRHEEWFSPAFSPLVLLYGAARGWKPELIADLKKQYPPLVFLPEQIGADDCDEVVRSAFAVYRERWEAGNKDAREHVEERFAQREPAGPHRAVLEVMRAALDEPANVAVLRGRAEGIAALVPPLRVPPPGQWRLRQGLSLAALFPAHEVDAWLSTAPRVVGRSSDLDGFVRRGLFLDVVWLRRRQSLLDREGTLLAEPRRAVHEPHGKPVYAPHRPDFENWEQIGRERIAELCRDHQARPARNQQTFRAGATDLIAGNWLAFCAAWRSGLGPLAEALRSRSPVRLAALLREDRPVEAESWQPAQGLARVHPLWDVCVAVHALHANDRSVFRPLGFRRHQGIRRGDARRLARLLLAGDPDGSADLLVELRDYCTRLVEGPLAAMRGSRRPQLLSLEEPCSWLSAWYLRIVTNSSHSPLAGPVFHWLGERFPEATWHGWPRQRSADLRIAFPGHAGRVQWQFLGREPAGRVVVAEVKSVTANNWGNKSKELYDRIAETRRAALDAGATLLVLGILDGDVDAQALEEIKAGHAYDETYTIAEVLGLDPVSAHPGAYGSRR